MMLTNELITTADTHGCNTTASTRGVLQVPEPAFSGTRLDIKGLNHGSNLPSHIKDASNVDHFKCLYKKWFFK